MTSDGTSVADADLEARGFGFFFRPLRVTPLLVLATGLLFRPSAYSELASKKVFHLSCVNTKVHVSNMSVVIILESLSVDIKVIILTETTIKGNGAMRQALSDYSKWLFLLFDIKLNRINQQKHLFTWLKFS